MSNRPENLLPCPELDLKLGIKSSLPHVKSTLALSVLLRECSDRPSILQYSEEYENETVLCLIKSKCLDLIVHCLLHNDEQANGKSKAVKEVEAESCAMAVSSFYGLDTSANSIPYLGSYSRDKTVPELRSSLQIIMETTDRLITEIDRHFAEVCAERGISIPERLEVKPGQTAVSREELFLFFVINYRTDT